MLFCIGLMLSISGIVYVYSAKWPAGDQEGVYFHPVVIKQIVWLVLALVAFFILQRVNWGLKPLHWLWFYIPVVIPLIAVLFVGTGHSMGANRWISIGPIDIQPSEFAKLAFILIMAWLYSAEAHRHNRNWFTALGILFSLMFLVIIQPDLGTALVFLFVFFVMSMFSHVKRSRIAGLALFFVVAAALAVFVRWDTGQLDNDGNPIKRGILKPHQIKRIVAFIDPSVDPQDAGYQIIQSEIAVGSGGLTGKGFLRGTQSSGRFIPIIESDFIFALVAEEFGFLGCLYVLALYFVLLARILAISRDAQSLYERYICYGVSAFIFFHIFVAAGMTVRLTPVTGLPLPFISQGGSSLMTMWLVLAICQSIYYNSRRDFRTLRRRS